MSGRDTVADLRRGTLAVAAAGIAGVAVELAVSRHWQSAVQLIAWAATGLLVVAVALAARAANGASPSAARLFAGSVCLASAFGVWEHVEGNYDAGPLDFRFATTWDTLGEGTRWWKALSGGVGAAPPIVPGALALLAAMVVVSTIGLGAGRVIPGATDEPTTA